MMASAAQRATTDINAILSRMEVPVLVKENNKEGKHVVARESLAAGQVLFEEIPIVCWPFSSFGEAGVNKDRGVEATDFCMHCLRRVVEGDTTLKCADCNTAQYCSAECQQRNSNVHSVLCGLETKLRAFHLAEEEKDDEDDAIPVGVEALARCVATIFIRYLAAAAQNPEATVAELFEAASTSINRFIEPPRDSEFEDIDASKWCDFLRDTMKGRMLSFFGEDLATVRHQQKEVVDALLSSVTLKTLLGQLGLNAQALNLVNPSSSGGGGVSSSSELDTFRLTVGGGLYTLQSCFNHSCQPNAEVQCGDNHEIKVVVTKDVEVGQEVNITYLSQLHLAFESAAQRRARLASYFFTCRCPKCTAEDNKLAAEEVDAAQKKQGDTVEKEES